MQCGVFIDKPAYYKEMIQHMETGVKIPIANKLEQEAHQHNWQEILRIVTLQYCNGRLM
jgi:hypothetical protein